MNERAQILITAIDQTKAALASAKANLEGLSAAASMINGVLAGRAGLGWAPPARPPSTWSMAWWAWPATATRFWP